MSDHSKILEKYEQMFENGSAFKPIMLNQPTPSIAEATGMGGSGGRQSSPLGEKVVREEEFVDPHSNYTEFDSFMEDKVNAIRNKTGIVNDNTSHVNMQGDVNY